MSQPTFDSRSSVPSDVQSEHWTMDDDDPADPRLVGIDIDAPIEFVPCERSIGVMTPEVP